MVLNVWQHKRVLIRLWVYTIHFVTWGFSFVIKVPCLEAINLLAIVHIYIPHAKLHRHHIVLFVHKVKKYVDVGDMSYIFLTGKDNLVDILSKYWVHQQVWEILQSILFWKGDNMELIPTHHDAEDRDDTQPIQHDLNINWG